MIIRLIKDWKHIKKGYILLMTKEAGDERIKEGEGIEYDGPCPHGENADDHDRKAMADYKALQKRATKKAVKAEKKVKEDIKEKATGSKLIGKQ